MKQRLFRVTVESPLFERTYAVRATSAREAASLATGEADLSVARGTVETVDRAVFKDRWTPRITARAIE